MGSKCTSSEKTSSQVSQEWHSQAAIWARRLTAIVTGSIHAGWKPWGRGIGIVQVRNSSDKIGPLGNQPGQHLHRPKGGPIPWRSVSLSHIYALYDPAPPLIPLEKHPLPWKSCPHAHHPICIYPNLLHHGSHIQRECFQRATTFMPVYYQRLWHRIGANKAAPHSEGTDKLKMSIPPYHTTWEPHIYPCLC